MLTTRLPRAFWSYLGFTAALLIYALIDGADHVAAGLALIAFLSWRLARGGRVAWTLLVLMNALPTIGTLAFLFSRTSSTAYDSGHVVHSSSHWAVTPQAVLLAVIFVGIEASLLSRSMRRHLDGADSDWRIGQRSAQSLPYG